MDVQKVLFLRMCQSFVSCRWLFQDPTEVLALCLLILLESISPVCLVCNKKEVKLSRVLKYSSASEAVASVGFQGYSLVRERGHPETRAVVCSKILLMSYSSVGGSHTLLRQSSTSESQNSRAMGEELTQEERFNQILLQAEELVQNEDVDTAIGKLRLLMEKINFMRQSKKDYDRKLELVCIYNLAAAYQKQWRLDDCIPLLEKFITLAKASLQDNLKTSATLSQETAPCKHWFKIKTVLVRGMLQYCAVLSQIGEHKKALRTAMEITVELKTLFRRGFEECSRQIAKRETIQVKKGLRKDAKGGIDKIQFSLSVLLSAKSSLEELSGMQNYQQITESGVIQAEMQEVKSHITYWKSIPENNIKTLRQSFQTTSEDPTEVKLKNQRNLLGVKRNQDWIEEFTIAKVMFMSPLNYLQFTDYDNLIFEFNHRNLIQKIFFLSVAYFSLSIELRFLEEEEPEQKKGKKRENEKEKEKLDLPLSEILHLKSIQVVCKHIKENSAFVNHLVFNYHKHYKNNLNTIVEQNSLAEYSELYDPKKQAREKDHQEEKNIRESENLILPTSAVYRKDSIYYEEEPSPGKEKNRNGKLEDPISAFRKPKKGIMSAEDKTENLTNLGSSTSFSRAGEEIRRKDKTLKKLGSAKIITLGKYQLQQLDKNDRSEKEISYKQMSSRSIKDKSLSRNKNFLKNSVTLKQNKSSSPTKERSSKHKNIRDLKESKDFSKKKSPEQFRALDLLKKSGSLHQFTGKNLRDSGQIFSSPETLRLKKKR